MSDDDPALHDDDDFVADVPVGPLPYGETGPMRWGPYGDPMPPQRMDDPDGSITYVYWDDYGPYRAERFVDGERVETRLWRPKRYRW